eukprot:NODE_727_length_1947_cov_26.888303_g673_i0.p1 GENE.NODE_727_length_1947_cov_26.888303_g673_i0~~NODE_727_length_1947_cov_26.888303_g673_i0.p1  ORF type:complete len:544 (+),score=77.73 NODE_727_length_1947_cov_26.888303_g673_i0:116-1747(+)
MNVVTVSSGRATWRSKGAFILAAVAPGLSSFIRLPFACLSHHPASFLLAFVICSVVLAAPLLLLELAVGQTFQHAPVGVAQKMNRRFRALGLLHVVMGWLMAVLTMASTSWVWMYVSASSWDPRDSSPLPSNVSMNWSQYLLLLVQWIVVWMALLRGVQSLSIALYMIIPFVLTIATLGAAGAIALPNSKAGLGELSNVTEGLDSLELWAAAAAQSFLSSGLGVGAMTTVGSYNRKSRDIVKWSGCIALINTTFAVLSCLTATAILGHKDQMGKLEASPDIMLQLIPTIFAEVSSGARTIGLTVMFFMLMGIGLASGLTGGLVLQSTLADCMPNIPFYLTASAVLALGCASSFFFILNDSYYLYEIMNYFIPAFGVTFGGILQCVLVGFFFDLASLRQKVRERGRDGWRRFIDYLSMGCFYSVENMQYSINRIEKSRVNRPIWCCLVKFVIPAAVSIFWVSELIRSALHRDRPLSPNHQEFPWYLMLGGWIIPFLAVLTVLSLLAFKPEQMEERPMWTSANDQDDNPEAAFEAELELELELAV